MLVYNRFNYVWVGLLNFRSSFDLACSLFENRPSLLKIDYLALPFNKRKVSSYRNSYGAKRSHRVSSKKHKHLIQLPEHSSVSRKTHQLNGCFSHLDSSFEAKFERKKRRASYEFVQARCGNSSYCSS